MKIKQMLASIMAFGRVYNMADKPKDEDRFYKIKNNVDGVPEIYIYDEIDSFFGVGAQRVVNDLNELGRRDKIIVRISSPGGDALEAANIYNALVRNPAEIHVMIDGQALSAAATLALSGNQITMAENAFLMFHEPYTRKVGNAAEFRDVAERLDAASDAIAKTLSDANRKDMTFEQAKEILKGTVDGTWFTADEALEAGIVDDITENLKIAASFNPDRFKFVPKQFLNRNNAKSGRKAELEGRLAKLAAAEI